MVDDRGILYIEPPAGSRSEKPIIDGLTRKMAAALMLGKPGGRYRGVHICSCGAHSSNCDHKLPNGEWTNSLCVHYLAFHRSSIPPEQLAKVNALDCGEIEPDESLLQ